MSFYTAVDNPKEMQKQVLIASKKLLGMLKKYENYRQIRNDKLDKVIQFKRVLDDLEKANKKLTGKMPKSALPKKKQEKDTRQEAKKLTALEKEMVDIEKRLTKLN